jgi:GNAT superfamily N-acetyltransferase
VPRGPRVDARCRCEVRATRTYLEMISPADLRPARLADPTLHLDRLPVNDAARYRDLYAAVGAAYRWTDRLAWTDAEIAAHLSDPAIAVHVLGAGAHTAGYFELKRDADGAIEIAYFGLLPAAIGRGLGGHLLTLAVEEAWRAGAARVWLHTSTLDHPHALANYLKRGFTVKWREEYEVSPA